MAMIGVEFHMIPGARTPFHVHVHIHGCIANVRVRVKVRARVRVRVRVRVESCHQRELLATLAMLRLLGAKQISAASSYSSSAIETERFLQSRERHAQQVAAIASMMMMIHQQVVMLLLLMNEHVIKKLLWLNNRQPHSVLL